MSSLLQVSSMAQVVKAFGKAYKKFCKNCFGQASSTHHRMKFAALWNEIIDSMRAEVS